MCFFGFSPWGDDDPHDDPHAESWGCWRGWLIVAGLSKLAAGEGPGMGFSMVLWYLGGSQGIARGEGGHLGASGELKGLIG